MNMSATEITLPHWAFMAIGQSDINVLMDRCEYETIIVTRQGHPDLVMMGHAEWVRLTDAAARIKNQHETAQAKPTEDTGHASAD
jgi:PHD/YefM family antitoxin component YafN of YafNO toxin-antitoxin module